MKSYCSIEKIPVKVLWERSEKVRTIRYLENESVIVKTPASLLASDYSVGKGDLVLTNKRLLFFFTTKNEVIELFLHKIEALKYHLKWGVLKTGIRVYTSQWSYTYKVKYPADWIELLNNQIGNLSHS